MAIDITYSLGSRGVAKYDVEDARRDTASALRPTLDAAAAITDYTGTVTLFNGRIIGVDDQAMLPPNVGTVTRVQAVDWTSALDARIVLGETFSNSLKAIVTELRDNYLVDYGITVDPSMAIGPTLDVSFDHLTMTEALNRIAELTAATGTPWVWRLTPGLVLEFFAVGTKVAAYSLTSSNGKIIDGVQWSRSRKQYVNRLHVEYGPNAVLPLTQTFAAATVGQTAWALDHTAVGTNLNGYIEVDGVYTPIGDDMTWYFDVATNTVLRSSGAAGGEVVVVNYNAQFPDTVSAEDAAEIATSGVWESTVKAADVTDQTEAEELAAALLLKYKAAPRTLTIKTREGFQLPGDVITLTIPERTVTGSWLITGVRIRSAIDDQFDYELTCVEGSIKQDSWQDVLRGVTSTGGSRASGTFTGHMLPAPSGTFEGVVSSYHTPLLIGAHMGFVGTTLGAGTIGPGIDMNAGASGAGRWMWVAGPAGPATKSLALLYVDATGAAATPALWWLDSSVGQYKLSPVTATSVTTPTVLGDKLQSFNTGRFAEVNARVLDASTGVLEQGHADYNGIGVDIAYDAANFTSSSGSWNVGSADQTTYCYTWLSGKTIQVDFTIQNTDVTGAPSELRIAIPLGMTALRRKDTTVFVVDNGVREIGQAYVLAATAYITIIRHQAIPFTTTSSDNTYVAGTITFEVT